MISATTADLPMQAPGVSLFTSAITTGHNDYRGNRAVVSAGRQHGRSGEQLVYDPTLMALGQIEPPSIPATRPSHQLAQRLAKQLTEVPKPGQTRLLTQELHGFEERR